MPAAAEPSAFSLWQLLHRCGQRCVVQRLARFSISFLCLQRRFLRTRMIIAFFLIAVILVVVLRDQARAERIEAALEYAPSPIWDAGFADDVECERKGLFGNGIRIGYSSESGRVLR